MGNFIKRLSFVALSTVGSVVSLYADGGGSSAYDFLTIPTSSHAFALGGSAPALIDDDVTLVDQNPALLGPEIEKQVAFNYMMYMQSGNFAGLRYGMASGENGAWAVGMRYLNYGSIPVTTRMDFLTARHSPRRILFLKVLTPMILPTVGEEASISRWPTAITTAIPLLHLPPI